jgi:hypothetical protein
LAYPHCSTKIGIIFNSKGVYTQLPFQRLMVVVYFLLL